MQCINLVNNYILPVTEEEEFIVYYYKMMGDSYRFIAEYSHGEEKKKAIQNAKNEYEKGV